MASQTAQHPNGTLNGSSSKPSRSTADLLPDFPAESDASASEDTNEESSSRGVSPVTSPPYWQQLHINDTNGNGGYNHNRKVSNVSSDSIPTFGAITLRDNENSDSSSTAAEYGRDRNRACWARGVEVTDHVLVNGSATNIGAFVVWNIRVETLSGSYMNIRKRYSEFDDFRRQLVFSFPNFEAAVPELPPKSVISKFRPRFLEKRRAGLQYFLNCILLNPEFSGSPVLKDFLFA